MSNTKLPLHHDGNEFRVLGRTISTPPRLMAAPMDANVIIPRDQWSNFEHSGFPITIKDQNGRGACQGFTDAETIEWVRWIVDPSAAYIKLSGWFPYAILCKGIDQGSNIGDGMKVSIENGIAPEEFVTYGTINPNKLSKQAFDEAKRFRLEIGRALTTFDMMVTAALLNRPFNFSIHVGENFNNLDSNGVVGHSPGPGNHSVTGGMGLKRLPNGKWALKFQNHWRKDWGQDGFGWFTEDHWENQPYRESYDCWAVSDDPKSPLFKKVA